MQNLWKAFKKHWITVWLIIAVSSLLSLGAYAAYTRITIAKRVVSTDAGVGDKFSSNLLKNAVMRKTIKSESNKNSDVTVEVYIYNYVYPKEYTSRNVDTKYSLTAKLGTISTVNSEEVFTVLTNPNVTGKTYKVDYSPSDASYTGATTKSFSATGEATLSFPNLKLEGGTAKRDVFTLTFDKSELGETPNGYWMELTAVPDDNSLPKLVGYVKVQLASGSSTGWSGKLDEGITAQDDAYNYIIEGNGVGTFTFKWDPTKVTINRQFLQNPENTFVINGSNRVGSSTLTENVLETEGTMKKLTIQVDSLNKKSRYEVQFFKVDTSFVYADISTYLPPVTTWTEASGNN